MPEQGEAVGTAPFKKIEACVFDAYGTLFDVHSAIGRYRDRLGGQADAISELWRAKQLQYTWVRTLMGRHADFWQLTEDALDYALETHNVRDASLRDQLLMAYLQLDCYREVSEVLGTLRAFGLPTVILSNGSPAMLEAAVTAAGLGGMINQCLSVEEVGVYKPHARVYQLAVDRLGIAPRHISFQSANGWDVAGAATFGYRVVWINRLGHRRERLPDGPDAELSSLKGLPALLGIR